MHNVELPPLGARERSENRMIEQFRFRSELILDLPDSLIHFGNFAPISARTISGGKPRGRAIFGASRPEGMYPHPSTTSALPRCFQVAGVTNGLPAPATRSKPLLVPV